MISAIIVAAGSSRRMGTDKLWLPLHGKPVVAHSLAMFQQLESIGEIIVVTRHDTRSRFSDLIQKEGYTKVVKIVDGGPERQHSVSHGLQYTHADADLVLIHDGARPLVTKHIVDTVAQAAHRHGAAVCGTPVTDTIKELDPTGCVVRTPARERLMAVQTPQIFQRALIVEAYRQLIRSNEIVTDDTAAIERTGKRVFVVPSDDPNIKITHPLDLMVADYLLTQRLKQG
jgi:2-C-methyl-D-erythritol 4-phosphate cytidylyltransferase